MKKIFAILAISACLLFVGCKKDEAGTTPSDPAKQTGGKTEQKPGETTNGEPGKAGGKEASGTQPAGLNPNLSKDQIDNRAGSQTK